MKGPPTWLTKEGATHLACRLSEAVKERYQEALGAGAPARRAAPTPARARPAVGPPPEQRAEDSERGPGSGLLRPAPPPTKTGE